MSRPSITGETIVVEIDGDILVWTDGLLSGTNQELISAAKWLSDQRLPVELTAFGPTLEADLNSLSHPEQAVAAMVGAKQGRARILKAPQSVIDILPFELNDDDDPEVEDYENNTSD